MHFLDIVLPLQYPLSGLVCAEIIVFGERNTTVYNLAA